MAVGKSFVNILFIYSLITQCLTSRVVVTDVGTFEGEQANDGDFFEFLGIPYGKVDYTNPFGVSSPYPALQGTFQANDDSAMCPQMHSNGTYLGTLDCLHLSVYVPTTATPESQLSVMVYIHGGLFMAGESRKETINPRFLIRHDVIVVSVRYRTGAYGFMCLNRRAISGNQGLKDQVLALKWIRDNIQPFGGNPNKVTLFGQSSGGASVNFHLLSEQEKLYNNVIIQSGSATITTVLYPAVRDSPIRLATYLGLPANNMSEALSHLVNADPLDVARATIVLDIKFKPCAETIFDGVEPFLTEYWIKSPIPKAQGVPIMIGFTEYELLNQHITGTQQHFDGLSRIFLRYLVQWFEFDDDRWYRMEDIVRRYYLGDSPLSPETALRLINFESDYVYGHPIQRTIKKFLDANAANIFYYMFSYSGNRNIGRASNVQGAGHGDDLRYIFDMASITQQITAEDQVMIDKMTTMWTNFAKNNDPTPVTTTLLPVKWIPLTNDSYNYLRIDSDFTMERRPFNRRMAFWDLFFMLNDDYLVIVNPLPPAEDDDDGNSSTVLSGTLINILLALILIVGFRE